MSETTAVAGAEVITFKIPAEEKAQLEAVAAREERTVSAVLRLLIRRYLAEQAA